MKFRISTADVLKSITSALRKCSVIAGPMPLHVAEMFRLMSG